MFGKVFGKRVKELRDKRGWSQDYVAQRLGMTRANVSNYEIQKNKKVPDDTLVKFADLFGVSTDYLLGKSDDAAKPETEFLTRLELSNNDELEQFTLVLDGKELSPEEARIAIAFLRTNRQMKSEK